MLAVKEILRTPKQILSHQRVQKLKGVVNYENQFRKKSFNYYSNREHKRSSEILVGYSVPGRNPWFNYHIRLLILFLEVSYEKHIYEWQSGGEITTYEF